MFGNNDNKEDDAEKGAASKIPSTAEQKKAMQQDENAALKRDQLEGVEPPMMEASKVSSHKIRKDEAHKMHIETTQKFHKAKTKEYESRKMVIKLHVTQYQQMQMDRALGIYDALRILHDPRSDAQIKAFDKAIEARDNKGKKKS